MRLSIVTAACLLVSALLASTLDCSPTSADVIHLLDGKKVDGRVIEYVDQHLRIELTDGKVIIRKITDVERIEFAKPASDGQPEAIESELKRVIDEAKPLLKTKTRTNAGIAMYLYTSDADPEIRDNEVGYKCYSGGGYSGYRNVPVNRAFVQQEYGRMGERRIELDPGPPYKIINRHVTIKAGEVVNLGRILLERQEFEGTASIRGTVRDAKGDPIPGVQVTANDKEAVSDAQGRYQLDGFVLENVSIEAKAKGYRGGTARVSIRNMQNRKIHQDVIMFRPRKVKLVYVISAKGDNSFAGPDVEKGLIELVVDSTRNDLSRYHYSSESFRNFAADTRLSLQFKEGKMSLRHSYGPIFYKASAAGVGFDAVKSVGKFDNNSQVCPPLKEGDFILIRGFEEERKAKVSPYCVKLLVEEVSLQPTDIADE